MYILWKKGIKGKIWRVIKKLNEQLRAKCRTRVEKSREFKIEGSLRQGGVLSVTLFAELMDSLSEELIKETAGVYYGGHIIPNLLLVDDVALLADTMEEMEKIHAVPEEFRMKNCISLSEKKSKIMIIHHDQTDREKVWTVDNTKLEQIENCTYLGEIINEKNNMNAHIENKQRKMEAVGRDMANITKD